MHKEYSIYDAKAQLSALVRQVRESGQTFIITVHGQPVAELRPVEADSVERQTLEQRFLEMEALGLITPSNRKPGEKPNFQPGEPKPGALKRFLKERD